MCKEINNLKLNIFNQIHKNIDEKQKNDVLGNAIKIFMKMPGTHSKINTSNVGLVVGKVQSGKTSNIIGLTSIALDNEYKTVIMMLSTTNPLLNQNYERIQNAFNCVDNLLICKCGDKEKLQFQKKHLDYLYTQNKKILICCLKHSKYLNEIKNILKDTDYAKQKVLIIDDEADNASQNTKKNKFGVNLLNTENPLYIKDRSTTNNCIVDLKNIFSISSYICVTATPYAQVFLHKCNDLKPNFCEKLTPGNGYCGLVMFHSPENERIITISDYHKKSLESSREYCPDSLKIAIRYFIATGILKSKVCELENYKHCMLINAHEQIKVHKKITENVGKYLDYLFRLFTSADKTHEFNNEFDPINEIFKKENYYNKSKILEPNDIVTFIQTCETHLLYTNKDCEARNILDSMKVFPNHIWIGSKMIDRGVTLPGLTISYFGREAKTAQLDTSLQRARWFGYRTKKNEKIELCKVFLTPQLKHFYEEIIDSERQLYEYLDDCSKMLSDISDTKMVFTLDPKLKPSAPNKTDYKRFDGGRDYIQTIFTSSYISNNENIELLRQYENNNNGQLIKFTDSQIHKYLKITFHDFKNILSKYKFYEGSRSKKAHWDIEEIFSACRANKYNNSSPIDFVSMRWEKGEERSLKEDCGKESPYQISRLMQGQTEDRKPGDPKFYPGDYGILQQRVMLQVHHIKLNGNVGRYHTGDHVVLLAILFPKSFSKSVIMVKTEEDILTNERVFA